ncbi:MAG: S8/S53 family peptidase [Gallionella sp.]|nr:S8/S53 family peptidase [Gallionella sp.]
MNRKFCTICSISSLLFVQNAFCTSWEIPQEPLRLNIGILRPNSHTLMDTSQSGVVDLLPTIGEHNLAAIQKDNLGLLPINQPLLIKWYALDADNTSKAFSSAAPFCSSATEAKLTSRAAAWEAAYGCLKGLADTKAADGTPFISKFLGANTTIYAVEPVLDLVNEELRRKRETSNKERQMQIGSKQTRFISASPVWPSGAPGWHLDKDYSQLASAYKLVFPEGINTEGSVLIAHLDTGYFPDDPMLPKYFNRKLSKTCEERETKIICAPGGEAHWDAKGLMVSPGHGTATLSNLAGNTYSTESKQEIVMGGNPSAHVFSINIHDSFIHLDSRRMAAGIEDAVENENADIVTLSHGGFPSLRLASAVDYAYLSGTPIFAATGDFLEFPLFLGRTFQSVVYPARYSQVMGVAGVTMDGKSYGENPSLFWWFSFGPDYFSRIGSWMLRGNFGPASVMNDGNIISTYVPNISRSSSEFGDNNVIGNDGGGTSHAAPQVSAAASLWLEKNKGQIGENKWRSWEKSEAVYQALSQSASKCFADYNIEHYGQGTLKALDALKWTYAPSSDNSSGFVIGPNSNKVLLTRREPADLDLPGVIETLSSARLPGQFEETVRKAFVNALATELSQLVFTSDKLQRYLQKLHICKPVDGCEKCTRQNLNPSHWQQIAQLVKELPDASQTLKDALLTITK